MWPKWFSFSYLSRTSKPIRHINYAIEGIQALQQNRTGPEPMTIAGEIVLQLLCSTKWPTN